MLQKQTKKGFITFIWKKKTLNSKNVMFEASKQPPRAPTESSPCKIHTVGFYTRCEPVSSR